MDQQLVRIWDQQDGQQSSPVVENHKNSGERLEAEIRILDRHPWAVGVAWLRDGLKNSHTATIWE